MLLQSIASRVPPDCFTQSQLWDVYLGSGMDLVLSEKTTQLVEKVLLGDSGIDKRHFAITEMDRIFAMDAESLNRRFEIEAPKLGAAALKEALDRAHLLPEEIDALVVCTCTGYICPGISSHVAEQTGLRRDAFLLDLVGLGCGAAVPSLRNAAALVAANPSAKVAVIAVEICSAAFFLDDDPGVIISACLFGDGASASIWSGQRNGGPPLRATDFDTLHDPRNRDILRFENSGGKLRNLLQLSVPAKAAHAVRSLYRRSCQRHQQAISQIIAHTGGRDVLLAIERALPQHALGPSKDILRQYGNMSSPSVLFALEQHLQSHPEPEGDLWLTAFGAGFAAHSLRLTPA